jgi:hypothetical protein
LPKFLHAICFMHNSQKKLHLAEQFPTDAAAELPTKQEGIHSTCLQQLSERNRP